MYVKRFLSHCTRMYAWCYHSTELCAFLFVAISKPTHSPDTQAFETELRLFIKQNSSPSIK